MSNPFFSLSLSAIVGLSQAFAPDLVASKLNLRPKQYNVRVDHATMYTSDKTKLVADVFHPIGVQKTPTVLVRIPFSESLRNCILEQTIGRVWAQRGYTVVIQGTRGRFKSEGHFYPMIHERQDGVETLDWLAKQSWYNGKIATWGGSASGQTAWSLCDRTSPGPSSMAIYLASSDFHSMFHESGAFAEYGALNWALISRGEEDLPKQPSVAEIVRAASGFPTIDADKRAVGQEIPFFRDWVRHEKSDDYWSQIDSAPRLNQVHCPAMLTAAWFDPFLTSELRDYQALRSSADRRVATNTRLIIGPWGHGHDVHLPNVAHAPHFRMFSFQTSLPWFDATVGSDDRNRQDTPPVRIFVMGSNQWRNENEWPLARALYTPYYLTSNGKANSSSGDGALSLHNTTKHTQHMFDYNPRLPVPTMGGAMLGEAAGTYDQSTVESRQDVLVYTTSELTDDVEVTGPVKAILYVATDAPNTDFTAKLVDVHPNGRAYNICDGIIRRNYAGQTESVRRIEINLSATSMVFKKQHKLRIEISSSNFPRFDRNPNTGSDIASETETQTAHQRVFHDPAHPSCIVLPVIPTESSIDSKSLNTGKTLRHEKL